VLPLLDSHYGYSLHLTPFLSYLRFVFSFQSRIIVSFCLRFVFLFNHSGLFLFKLRILVCNVRLGFPLLGGHLSICSSMVKSKGPPSFYMLSMVMRGPGVNPVTMWMWSLCWQALPSTEISRMRLSMTWLGYPSKQRLTQGSKSMPPSIIVA
jgi:hypothetical protein